MSWCKLDTDVHKIFSCKVSFKCCCQVDSWLLIKNFEHSCDQVLSEWYFREKNTTTTEVAFIQLLSYNVVSKQKKNKNENKECHGIFIPFKSLQLKTREFHFSPVCSHPEVLCKKDVLRNFAKFTGKHLCQKLFFLIKLQA